jgi:hypothetical protein
LVRLLTRKVFIHHGVLNLALADFEVASDTDQVVHQVKNVLQLRVLDAAWIDLVANSLY